MHDAVPRERAQAARGGEPQLRGWTPPQPRAILWAGEFEIPSLKADPRGLADRPRSTHLAERVEEGTSTDMGVAHVNKSALIVSLEMATSGREGMAPL